MSLSSTWGNVLQTFSLPLFFLLKSLPFHFFPSNLLLLRCWCFSKHVLCLLSWHIFFLYVSVLYSIFIFYDFILLKFCFGNAIYLYIYLFIHWWFPIIPFSLLIFYSCSNFSNHFENIILKFSFLVWYPFLWDKLLYLFIFVLFHVVDFPWQLNFNLFIFY